MQAWEQRLVGEHLPNMHMALGLILTTDQDRHLFVCACVFTRFRAVKNKRI